MKNFAVNLYEKFKATAFGRFVCNHPYMVGYMLVVLHLCITNQYRVYDMFKAKSTLSKLNQEYTFYQNKIQEDSLKLHNLKTDNNNLIKFAREAYRMKGDKEDVYVLMYK